MYRAMRNIKTILASFADKTKSLSPAKLSAGTPA